MLGLTDLASTRRLPPRAVRTRSVGPEAEPLQVSAHGALRAAELRGDLVQPPALVAVAPLVIIGESYEAERLCTQFAAPAESCCASVT
jgi:hypothetical protein